VNILPTDIVKNGKVIFINNKEPRNGESLEQAVLAVAYTERLTVT